MTLRVIAAEQVRRLLPMSSCIDLMSRAMQAASSGQILAAPRLISALIDRSGYLGLMPGSALQPRVYGAKVVSLHPGNPTRGRPAIQGFIALFDHDTGSPIAIVEGSEVTAIRTAAASGLATRTLARSNARTHGVFGAGVQAAVHVEAVNAVRPIEEVLIWARDSMKAQQLASELKERLRCEVRATSNPAEAAGCDIVSTVTGASEPVLRGEWLHPGAHVNLVGAHSPTTREADDETMRRSAIYVDLMQSAMSEAGDLLIPMGAGVISSTAVRGELAQVIAGTVAGRAGDRQITLYKSLGIVAQDLVAAAYVYEMACERNVGCEVAL